MDANHTTAVVQLYLDELAGVRGDQPAEPLVRDLLSKSARRLHLLCASMLHRSYPRLARPPLNLDSDEMLSAVVERLLRALREVRPGTVAQSFALANQHMRWELNDLARRLDGETPAVELDELAAAAPQSSASELSIDARRILDAIEGLPDEEREAFSLVRIQGLMYSEAASILCVSTRTVQRRLNRSLVTLAHRVGDLRVENRSIGEA